MYRQSNKDSCVLYKSYEFQWICRTVSLIFDISPVQNGSLVGGMSVISCGKSWYQFDTKLKLSTIPTTFFLRAFALPSYFREKLKKRFFPVQKI